MHELRSLQLFANILTNKGLSAILDNCPNLESLDIRHCYNVDMDASLRAKCARIKVLRPPDDYDFHRVCTPRRLSFSTPIIQFGRLSSSRPIIHTALNPRPENRLPSRLPSSSKP
uniref:Transport inhibitor response 1 domain-containing protein n=1 Tax=Oryza barthii TaxID=65489 RepID=A0A0D3GX77_9ORYZ